MRKLGEKQLMLELKTPIVALPAALAGYDLELSPDGDRLVYRYDTQAARTGIASLLADLNQAGIAIRDLDTSQRSLEDIFVKLVRESA